jgi:hypothetical protein
MFFSPFLAQPSGCPACLGPYRFSPSGFSPPSLSLIPAAHSALKTVSRSQPSKQTLSSYYWLSAVSCQLPIPSALVRQTPPEPLRSACLSSAPPTARRFIKAAPLSPLAATLTKNAGRTRKGVRKEVGDTRINHYTQKSHLFPVFSKTSEQLRAQRGAGVSWRNPKPGRRMRAPNGTGNWTTSSETPPFASRFGPQGFS